MAKRGKGYEIVVDLSNLVPGAEDDAQEYVVRNSPMNKQRVRAIVKQQQDGKEWVPKPETLRSIRRTGQRIVDINRLLGT